MNRAQRRAAAKGKRRTMPERRVHPVLLKAEGLPTPGADRIVSQKLVLLAGIAALKDGTFGHDNLCKFHDFIALALRWCDAYKDEKLRRPAEECAKALIGVMERHTASGRYGANGDELRALQDWVEEITDYMAQFPEWALKELMDLNRADELELTLRIAFDQTTERENV
ncbi:hypothetical protein [Cupriavidus metallidurans]